MTLRVCARPPRALLPEGWEKSPRTCPLALWHFAEGTSIAPCSSELVHHICALEVTGEATPPTARESLTLGEYTQEHTHTPMKTQMHTATDAYPHPCTHRHLCSTVQPFVPPEGAKSLLSLRTHLLRRMHPAQSKKRKRKKEKEIVKKNPRKV